MRRDDPAQRRTALIQTLTTEERIAVARDFVTQLLIVAFSL